ncbi:MAG: type B 50S ribosomal protein L31 [Planctomycetes bacterium]|nr:type B 50S ribosomal protein L31 [Planctomycetota bacterium]
MKWDIHPQNYRPVVFQDRAAGISFLTRSTIETKKTVEWKDGKEYPVYNVDISSASHPFYTGKQMFVDTAGRIEKFRTKFGSDYSQKPKKDKKGKDAETEWDDE